MQLTSTVDVDGDNNTDRKEESYIIDDTLWLSVGTPSETGQWTSSVLSSDEQSEIWDRKNPLSLLLTLITSTKTDVSPQTSQINELDCNVLYIAPDSKIFASVLQSLLRVIDMPDISEYLQDKSLQLWITADNHLLVKAKLSCTVFQAENGGYIAIDMVFSNYNQEFDIQLPQ